MNREDLKLELETIYFCYGFLLKHPAKRQKFTNYQVADAIKNNYSFENPRNKYFYDICMNHNFVITI